MLSKTKLFALVCSLALFSCADNPFGSIDEDPATDGPPSTTGGGSATDGDSGGTGTDPGGVTTGTDSGGVALGCGDFASLSRDFSDNQLPAGFSLVTNPNFLNGQMELSFPATPAGSAHTPLTLGIISDTEYPVDEGRIVLKMTGVPAGSSTQAAIKLRFGTNVVGTETHEVAAEIGRGPGTGFLWSRDGVDNNSIFFDDTGVNWLSMRLDQTTVYAESSVDGVTWKTEGEVPRLGDSDAIVQIQAHQYAGYESPVNIIVDELNTNCPTD